MRRTALALAAACLAVTAASAADWPTKPVRIIAPFAAGGAADALGRLVAEPLSDVFKEQFFVENRGGAGGRIGELAGAKAEPDGYTLVISAMSASVVAPASTPNIGYDPMKDFTHIAYLGGSPNVLVVHPSLPARNFKDLLAYLKSHKEGTGYISAGLGTAGNLLAEALARKENFKIDHIPYKGAGPAMVDLVAGHV